MTTSTTADRTHLETRRRYRRLMNGSLGIGIVGLIAAFTAWRAVPEDALVFAGVGVYWLGFLGYVAIWKTTSVTLFDEREEQIEFEAGNATMTLFGTVLVFAAPAVVGLDMTGIYTASPFVRGAISAYVLLFVVFGIACGYVKWKRS